MPRASSGLSMDRPSQSMTKILPLIQVANQSPACLPATARAKSMAVQTRKSSQSSAPVWYVWPNTASMGPTSRPQDSSSTRPGLVSGPRHTAPRPAAATNRPTSPIRANRCMPAQFQAMKKTTPATRNSAPPSRRICRR